MMMCTDMISLLYWMHSMPQITNNAMYTTLIQPKKDRVGYSVAGR